MQRAGDGGTRHTERRLVPSGKSSAHTNAATKPLPGKGVLQPWPRREGVERRAGQQQIRDTSISQGGGMASAADGNGNSTTYKHSSQVRPMLHPCTDAPLTARRTNDDVDVEHATWIREYRRMPVQSGHVGLWPLGLIIVGVPSVLLGDPLDGRHCRRASPCPRCFCWPASATPAARAVVRLVCRSRPDALRQPHPTHTQRPSTTVRRHWASLPPSETTTARSIP